jgi:hypothetical protein
MLERVGFTVMAIHETPDGRRIGPNEVSRAFSCHYVARKPEH